MILEINQAGLSWETILNKEENFKEAYSNFEIEKVAKYNSKDIERLLLDAGIIRNKLKVNAAIHNAQQIIQIKEELVLLNNGWTKIIHYLRMNGLNCSKRRLNL